MLMKLMAEWKNVNEAREKFGVEEFDNFLKGHLTCGLGTSSNINDLWKDFKKGKYTAFKLGYKNHGYNVIKDKRTN